MVNPLKQTRTARPTSDWMTRKATAAMLVTRLLAGVPGLVAKDGAEGVYAAALPDGPTVAFKIDDGATRAAEVTVVGALLRSGVDAAVLTESATVPVHGGGRPVGVVRSLLTPDLADRREIAPAAG